MGNGYKCAMRTASMISRVLLTFALIIFASAATGEDFYVTQSGAGTGDGLSLGNAWSVANLNTSGNWGVGVGKVSAGDRVRLNGTLTTAITVAGSGTEGSPVTIYFESGATMSKALWASTGAIAINGQSYITIDAAVPSAVHIENTANGTAGTYANTAQSCGIDGTYGADLVILNTTITNIYRRVAFDDDDPAAHLRNNCINVSGNGLVVSNCNLSEAVGPVSYSGPSSGNWSNVFIVNNRIFNCNHSITIGLGDSGSQLRNVHIRGNIMDGWSVWDNTDNSFHMDGNIIFNNSTDDSSILVDLYIGQNAFGASVTGTTPTSATGAIVFYLGGRRQLMNSFIWSNTFRSGVVGWGNGAINSFGSNHWGYCNTSLDDAGGLTFTGTNGYFYNNILSTNAGVNLNGLCKTNASALNNATNNQAHLATYLGRIYSDYNILPDDQSGVTRFSVSAQLTMQGLTIWGPLTFSSIYGWQTYNNNSIGMDNPVWNLSHADPNSTTNLPAFVVGTLRPATQVAGTNLTTALQAVSGYIPELLLDYDGTQRSASGDWTKGAFEYVEASPPAGEGPAGTRQSPLSFRFE